MKYKIDKEKRPIYLQLYKQIKEDIINGAYKYNSKLPSKRLLADETGASIITIEHAYELLCDEGYVEARERSGYFVIFRKTDGFVKPLEASLTTRSANYQTHSNLDFPFSVLSKTMRNVLTNYGEELLSKSPNQGCNELRVAIKNYLARNRGISVDIERIVIGSGAEYLYGLIIDLIGRDKTYGIEHPSYKKIEQVYKANDVKYLALPLASDGIDSLALVTTKAHVLHTTPYRSYPTGVTASASKRHEYISWSSKGERFIIEDDFESEFSLSTKAEDTLFSLSSYDNVIYLNTFTKTISPSLRVGYMVLPKKLINTFNEKLGFYSCTVPTFEQLVITKLLENGDFERHVNRVRRTKRKQSTEKA